MSMAFIESANTAFEEGGIERAEQVLINYYKTDVNKITHWIKNSSAAFAVRYGLIQRFFEDHFAERYHASVPFGLIIVDGAVNDFKKSKGFFAEGTAVDAWDCLVGYSDGLTKLKGIFNQNRTKTNTETITLPYRNGILHGRDLNYANEYVSCKRVSLMFTVADWMKMKNSEDTRKAKYEKSVNPSPIRESLARISVVSMRAPLNVAVIYNFPYVEQKNGILPPPRDIVLPTPFPHSGSHINAVFFCTLNIHADRGYAIECHF